MAGVLEENQMTYESRVFRTPPKVDSLLLNNHPFAIATSYSSSAYQDGYAYIYEAGGVFNTDETARRRLPAFSSNTTTKRSHRAIIRICSSGRKLACTMVLDTAVRMREQTQCRAETISGISCADETAADGIGIVKDGDLKQP
jgi:rhamnose utilization protein RhaD (predicted bifunctional aldolase and dehydrogenase)